MSSRQERRKLINGLTTSSKNINGTNKGSQFNHFLQLTKRHINISGSSFHADFNADETARQLSVVSGRDRDNLVSLLTNQKNALEFQNKNLRKQIQILNINASSNNEVSDQYSTPYVKMCEEVDVFAARYYIRPEEYEKIEYQGLWLSLFDASIRIYKTKDFEFETPKRVLQLKHIKEVRYMGNVMLFEFEPSIEDCQYLFIKFRDYNHLKKWDFALYINKIIEGCLNKEKLFHQEINLQQQLSIITKKAGGGGNMTSSLYQRRKVSYNDNLVKSDTLEHNENTKISKSSSVKNVHLHEGWRGKEKGDVLNEEREDSEKNSSVNKRFKNEKNNTFELYQQIEKKKKELENKQTVIEKVNWGYQEQDPHKTPSNNNNNSRIQYNSSFGIQQFVIKPMPAIDLNQKSQEKNGVPLDVSTLTNSAETRKKILNDLKQPKFFIKCAEGGIRQRPKEVYLSENQYELCWKDLQTNRVRKVNVDDIADISKNQKGEGLMKHAKKIAKENCLVIRTKDKQAIELYSQSAQLIADFADNLELIVFGEERTNKE